MNSFLIGVRNVLSIIVLAFIGLYVVTLLELNGTLPETEISQNVIDAVIAKLEEIK